MVLPVASAVAVLPLPVNAPVKLVEATEDNPVTDVTVPPSVIVVVPNVVLLFTNFAFVKLPSATAAEATLVST